MGFTPARERVCRFVYGCLHQRGHSRSYEEIRHHMGSRSLNSLSDHVKQRERRGYPRTPRKSRKRSFELLPIHTGGGTIPFLGTVAAGTPIEPIEIPESIEVPESFLGNGQNFALRVRGDSMVEEGIREGDILIVSRQNRVANGQTVVALVNGGATVKKFYGQGEEVELRPANSRMNAIRAPASDVEIVGAVVGLLRRHPRSP